MCIALLPGQLLSTRAGSFKSRETTLTASKQGRARTARECSASNTMQGNLSNLSLRLRGRGGVRPCSTTGTRGVQMRNMATRVAQNDRAASSSYTPVPVTGKARVMELLAQGQNLYSAGPEMKEAVERMILENPTNQPGLAVEQGLGTGTWQVFWAPHIASLSTTLLGTRFDILYKFFPGGKLVSNVHFNGSLSGQGWLNSSGSMSRKFDDTVEISFDKFWVDVGGDPLREELTEEKTSKVLGLDINVDGIMTAVGRASFFPQFAVFPVLYLDMDLAVFAFPPLKSKIAIRRELPTE